MNSYNAQPTRRNGVAGPGFFINIRPDQHHIGCSQGGLGGAGKVSQWLPGARSSEVYDIVEGEVLVCKKESTLYHDSYSHCITSCNGWVGSKPSGKDDIQVVRDWILKQVDFVGIAHTGYTNGKIGSWAEQGSVARVAGVVTVTNESTQDIHPGQSLALGVALAIGSGRKAASRRGVPKEKVVFSLEPISGNLEQWAVDQAKAELGVALVTEGDNENLGTFLAAYRKANNRICGVAYSQARPGETFEFSPRARSGY
jgi:hypothetical protein